MGSLNNVSFPDVCLNGLRKIIKNIISPSPLPPEYKSVRSIPRLFPHPPHVSYALPFAYIFPSKILLLPNQPPFHPINVGFLPFWWCPIMFGASATARDMQLCQKPLRFAAWTLTVVSWWPGAGSDALREGGRSAGTWSSLRAASG